MMLNTKFLMRLRSIIIDLLNTLDDELIAQGAIACRAIPSKSMRRKMQHVDVEAEW